MGGFIIDFDEVGWILMDSGRILDRFGQESVQNLSESPKSVRIHPKSVQIHPNTFNNRQRLLKFQENLSNSVRNLSKSSLTQTLSAFLIIIQIIYMAVYF